ncbi:hypothetical protein HOLleu_19026 [Holothuria leucospilota]|uniref:Uncharacterized protein n=1 Tax=Holothuria leucospilota TaxID=206669 RepID=A0A9Q1HA38_HOLLE|nr:hypothetical protein HOLleu_19026 [Holothuria leucospilota]
MAQVKSSFLILCTVLCFQEVLSVYSSFNSLDDFLQYMRSLRRPSGNAAEQSTTEITTDQSTSDDIGTEWSTTFFPTTETPRPTIPSRLLNRCCSLGRDVHERGFACHMIDDASFLSKDRYRNRPQGNNFKFDRVGSFIANSRDRHLFETCASVHARELRDEFMRCCKEGSLRNVDGRYTLVIDTALRQNPKHRVHYQPGTAKRWS